MEQVQLGKTGLKISKISLGTMNFGGRVNKETSFKIMDKAHSLGLTGLDTANVYGQSESIIGEWFKKSNSRDEFVISSKVGWPMSKKVNDQNLSTRHISSQINKSINKLNTEFIDIYQPHGLGNDVKLETVVEIFTRIKSEGLISIIGAPLFCKAWKLIQWHEIAQRRGFHDIEYKQIPFSLISRSFSKSDIFEICDYLDIPIMGFGVLGGGLLTGKYSSDKPFPEDGKPDMKKIHETGDLDYLVARLGEIADQNGIKTKDVALSFALNCSNISAFFIGASNPSQLEDIVNTLEIKLKKDEIKELTELSEKYFIW